MDVLIVNPIPYTSETKNIIRANTIKDTMIYDLCLGFLELGHSVTLYAAEPFKPISDEEYPFFVVWGQCSIQKIFMPHRFPYMPRLKKYIKDHLSEIDMIITSEVFSVNSLVAVRAASEKTIIWHELARHNAMMKKMPSRIWYNIVARLFMGKVKVVPRSKNAQMFIKRYCKNTLETVIDHGVNLDKFIPFETKTNSFVVCSQLIPRKRIDGILYNYAKFISNKKSDYCLYVIGDGELRKELIALAGDLDIAENIVFTGKLQHSELLPYLASAKALLVNTERDNSMISIVESIAVGTPIITTDIPLNCTYIKSEHLGIVRKVWDENDLEEIVMNNTYYTENCLKYRRILSTKYKVRLFEKVSGGSIALNK